MAELSHVEKSEEASSRGLLLCRGGGAARVAGESSDDETTTSDDKSSDNLFDEFDLAVTRITQRKMVHSQSADPKILDT